MFQLCNRDDPVLLPQFTLSSTTSLGFSSPLSVFIFLHEHSFSECCLCCLLVHVGNWESVLILLGLLLKHLNVSPIRPAWRDKLWVLSLVFTYLCKKPFFMCLNIICKVSGRESQKFYFWLPNVAFSFLFFLPFFSSLLCSCLIYLLRGLSKWLIN